MQKNKSIVAFLLFMLPAFSMLAAYAVFSEKINQKPGCGYNCDSPTTQSASNSKIKSTLELIDFYRQKYSREYQLFSNNDVPLFSKPTETDLAFLQEKIKALHAAYFDENDITIPNSKAAKYANEQYASALNASNANIATESEYLVTLNNRSALAKEIHQYAFNDKAKLGENERILLANAGNESSSLPTSNKNEGVTFPNFKPVAPLAFSKPTQTGNDPFIVALSNAAINITPDNGNINAVPLTASQYFMLFGLMFLFLLLNRKNTYADFKT
jgi:hypothetical protein